MFWGTAIGLNFYFVTAVCKTGATKSNRKKSGTLANFKLPDFFLLNFDAPVLCDVTQQTLAGNGCAETGTTD